MNENKKFYVGIFPSYDKSADGGASKETYEIAMSDEMPKMTHDSFFMNYYASFDKGKYKSIDCSSMTELSNEHRFDHFWNMRLRQFVTEAYKGDYDGFVYEMDAERAKELRAVSDCYKAKMDGIKDKIRELIGEHLDTALEANKKMFDIIMASGRMLTPEELVDLAGDNPDKVELENVANEKAREILASKRNAIKTQSE